MHSKEITIEILMKENREQLNARALELGIKVPEKLDNKEQVCQLIIMARKPKETVEVKEEVNDTKTPSEKEEEVFEVDPFYAINERLDKLENPPKQGESEKESKPEISEKDLNKKRKTTIRNVKSIRRDLDTVFRLACSRSLITPKIEDSIFLSKSWLGKSLATFGTTNPYAGENKVKTKKDIPATADVAKDETYNVIQHKFSLLGDLEAVLFLRANLEKLIGAINKTSRENASLQGECYATMQKSINHASEAKFYLGQILSEIRNN